jgi:hypothetical protein
MEFPASFPSYGLKPNGDRAKALLIFFRIVQILLLLKLVLDISAFFSISDGHISHLAWTVIVFFGLIAIIPSSLFLGIFFVLWMSRAYHNLHKADLEGFLYKKEWAVAGWFVPIRNFYVPYQIIKEIYDDSQIAFRNEQEIFKSQPSFLVKYWWLFYIAGIFFNATAMFLALESFPQEILTFCTICTTISMFFSSLFGIRMIRNISVIESEMFERSIIFRQQEISQAAQDYLSYADLLPETPSDQ